MKNFRKVLALVLVVATLFSFAAMAGAKTLADYTDAEAVNYDVAVEVLSALEILNGYEDDTFKPTNTISREEMAKMIAVLANAGDDVSALYAAANAFADVENTRWSASYITYCAQTGIVAGRSAETFDPYGKVTGLETAKMLLVTMGFDAAEQGYVGANWKINVLRDAKNFGLLNGFAAGYDVDAAITREEAANMMLNALQAPVVIGVLSDDIVKITNALYNKDHGIQATLKDAEKYGWIKLYGNVIVADKDLTLGEALYDNRLVIDTDATDCYGRPGTVWSLQNKKGTKIFTGMFVADAIVTSDYTGEIDLNEVLEEEYKLGDYALTAYVDGKLNSVSMNAYNDNGTGTDDTDHLDTFAAANIGKGVLVEVYVNDAEKEITVVVINTYVGTVSAAVKASNTFVVDGLCFSNKGYDFAEDDVILYWLCGEKAADLHDAKVIEPIVATVTRAETKGNDETKATFTADGVVYEYAFKNDCNIIWYSEVDKTYDIYVDLYGYVVDYAEHKDETEFFYGFFVEESGSIEYGKSYADGSRDYTALKDVVDFTAAYNKDVAVTEALYFWANTEANEIGRDWNVDDLGTLVKYSVDEDGRAVKAAEAQILKGDAYKLNKNGDVVVTGWKDDYVLAYGNDDTKYLVRTWDYAAKDYIYTAYTQDTLPYTFKNINGIQLFTEKVGVKQQTTVATYVFIDSLYAEVASHAFVLGYAKSVVDVMFKDQIGAYHAYEAVIDGAEGYLLVDEARPVHFGFVEGELQVIGLYDDGKPVYADVSNKIADVKGETIEYIGGELVYKYNSVPCDDDIFVVIIDQDDKAVILESVEALNDYVESLPGFAHGSTDDSDDCYAYVFENAWFVEEDGVVTELYIDLTVTD